MIIKQEFSKMKTHNADYKFLLKELPEPEPFNATWALECYPQTKQLPGISNTGSLYIRLKKEVSEEQAKQLADQLNGLVEDFTLIT
tara:strand:- start:1262 stop:1519 length:258 start_codon:yes stop_codon:yes gene_type:complete